MAYYIPPEENPCKCTKENGHPKALPVNEHHHPCCAHPSCNGLLQEVPISTQDPAIMAHGQRLSNGNSHPTRLMETPLQGAQLNGRSQGLQSGLQYYGEGYPRRSSPPTLGFPRTLFGPRSHGQHQVLEGGPTSSPLVTDFGTIAIQLKHGVIVDVALDKSVRLSCSQHDMAMSLSGNRFMAGLIHPYGNVFHESHSTVYVLCMEPNGNHKYAKITDRGVCFRSETSPLHYLVDPAGVRTTTTRMVLLDYDFTWEFRRPFKTNERYIERLVSVMQQSFYKQNQDRSEVWMIHGIKIIQDPTGATRVIVNQQDPAFPVLRLSPADMKASLKCNDIHITASGGQKSHLYVRKENSRIHKDAESFQCRSAAHSAGFDSDGVLKIFN